MNNFPPFNVSKASTARDLWFEYDLLVPIADMTNRFWLIEKSEDGYVVIKSNNQRNYLVGFLEGKGKNLEATIGPPSAVGHCVIVDSWDLTDRNKTTYRSADGRD